MVDFGKVYVGKKLYSSPNIDHVGNSGWGMSGISLIATVNGWDTKRHKGSPKKGDRVRRKRLYAIMDRRPVALEAVAKKEVS